jgi:cytochrome oxidase assembly protein ShyY1
VYRFLLSRRWLGVWAALLVVIPAFIALGRWQLDRFDQRVTANRLIRTNLAAAPVPVERLARPARLLQGRGLAPGVRGAVRRGPAAAGRNRTSNGRTGFHVLIPLVTESGTAVLVDRGWIPAGETAGTPGAAAGPTRYGHGDRPAAGVRHGSTGGSDMPAGQIAKIDIGRLSGELGLPSTAATSS